MTPYALTAPYALTVDPGLRDLAAADRLLHGLAARLGTSGTLFGCTHLLRGDRPRVAVSLAADSPALLAEVRARLGDEGHETADGVPDAVGRAVLFPGEPGLRGTVSVADALTRTAIDRVVVLGSAVQPAPEQALLTRNHVRPQWRDGELVLTAMPAAGGTLVPFEVPAPTPCCADH